MELRIKKLDTTTPAPSRAHEGDAGLDLYSAEDVWIGPGSWSLVNTGMAVAVPHGHVGDVRSRSGLGVKGVVVAQGVGTIDAGYRGEVKVNLHNRTSKPYLVGRGDRIAQLVIIPVALPEVVVVDDLDPTKRGDTGHGGTGR